VVCRRRAIGGLVVPGAARTERPAVRPLDAGECRRHHGRGGRRRAAGEQVQVTDRRVPQAQRVDRELRARLGGEKGGDRLGRRGQCGPAMDGTPLRERATAER
jgi:hypothetical protein